MFKAAEPVIAALLEHGNLLARGTLVHSYPHSWRSKAPLIFRATAQWFIPMEGADHLRDKALAAIDETRFVPGARQEPAALDDRDPARLVRLAPARLGRADRGVRPQGAPARCCATPRWSSAIARAFEAEGADAWWTRDPQEFLGNAYAADDYEKVDDILDVWFESGCTHATVLEQRPELQWPASLYLEGSDQHRGWFHSSLLESCGTRGRAPYDAVLTHGFVMDADGRKMSKSLGNVVSPIDLMKTHGADILRLWVVSGDYTEDLRIGKEILDGIADTYRRLRNTLRYLLGNLAGFTEAERLPAAQMPELERWVLHRLAELDEQVRTCNREFDYPKLGGPAARFLRRRPVGLLLRRAQGRALLRPGRQLAPPRRAHRARRAVPLPDRLAGAGAGVHDRGGVAHPLPARGAACICAPSPTCRPTGATRRWARAGSGSARCAAWSPGRWSSSARRSGSAPACRRAPTVYLGAADRAAAGRARSRRARDHQRHRARRRPGAGRCLHARRRAGRGRGARPGRGREMRALLAGPAGGRGLARASLPALHGCRRHGAGGLSDARTAPAAPVLALAVLVAGPGHQMAGAAARSTPTSRSTVTPFFNLVLVWNRGVSFGMLDGAGRPRPLAADRAGGGHRRLSDRLALSRDAARDARWPCGWCWPVRSATRIDRLRFGAVVDFLDFHAFGYHWPAFNVADSAIVIGAGLILLDSLVLSQTRTKLGRGEG